MVKEYFGAGGSGDGGGEGCGGDGGEGGSGGKLVEVEPMEAPTPRIASSPPAAPPSSHPPQQRRHRHHSPVHLDEQIGRSARRSACRLVAPAARKPPADITPTLLLPRDYVLTLERYSRDKGSC